MDLLAHSIEAGARAIAARFTAVPFDALDDDVRRDALDEARVVLEAVNHAGAVETLRAIVDMDPHDGHVQRDVAARWLAEHGHTR